MKPLAPEDPVLRSSRREALVALVIWLSAMAYTVGFSLWQGYGHQPGEMPSLVLGIPAWLVWGVIAPWLVCIVVSCWFAYGWMSDEPLGANEDAADDVPEGFEDAL
jgi:hypothetical protein